MKEYMTETVLKGDRFSEDIRGACLNKHANCVEWSAEGECEANKKYMATSCAPACQTCHLLIFEERCPWTPTNDTNIWKAGDLDAMFERLLTTEITEKYEIEVLSRPPEGPWVVTLDNFLTDEETDRLIALGGNKGYDKSMDVGTLQPDGTYSDYESPDRTSTNTWCLDSCYEDALTQTVVAKIEDVTGIPDAYAEYLQLLKYNVGQKYGQHHDYIPHTLNRSEGVRVATLFLYLNDVEAGGGTNFPLLGNLTVMPKKGKALLWPSVLNDDPNAKDGRTDHEALPVEAGIKYGANAWLHNRDFKETYGRGCA
jgi:prolyl 4-hydroxylase